MKGYAYYFALAGLILFLPKTLLHAGVRDVIYQGKVYKNASVLSASNGNAQITSDNGEVTVPIGSLFFGLKAEAEQMAMQAARDDEQTKLLRQKAAPLIERGALCLMSTVLQKTPDGILLNPKPIDPRFAGLSPYDKAGFIRYDKVALLKNHPRANQMVDGDSVISIGVPTNNYTYTDVNGATRTVRAFMWVPNPLNAQSTQQ